MTVRMIRRAQIDSSDGALVREWIADYTNAMRAHRPQSMEIQAWMQAYGDYGIAHWTFDAPDIATLDEFLSTHGTHADVAEVLKRGSSLFTTGHTKDVLLKELKLS
jgi:hypothetical protein